MKSIIEFLCVAAAAATLLAAAHFAAPGEAQRQVDLVNNQRDLIYQLFFERTFLTVAVSMTLMIPAFWLYILQRRSGPSNLWRSFWTMSYLGFVVHLYWAWRLLAHFHGLDPWNPANIPRVLFESP